MPPIIKIPWSLLFFCLRASFFLLVSHFFYFSFFSFFTTSNSPTGGGRKRSFFVQQADCIRSNEHHLRQGLPRQRGGDGEARHTSLGRRHESWHHGKREKHFVCGRLWKMKRECVQYPPTINQRINQINQWNGSLQSKKQVTNNAQQQQQQRCHRHSSHRFMHACTYARTHARQHGGIKLLLLFFFFLSYFFCFFCFFCSCSVVVVVIFCCCFFPQAYDEYMVQVASQYEAGLPEMSVDHSALVMPRRMGERVDLEVTKHTLRIYPHKYIHIYIHACTQKRCQWT